MKILPLASSPRPRKLSSSEPKSWRCLWVQASKNNSSPQKIVPTGLIRLTYLIIAFTMVKSPIGAAGWVENWEIFLPTNQTAGHSDHLPKYDVILEIAVLFFSFSESEAFPLSSSDNWTIAIWWVPSGVQSFSLHLPLCFVAIVVSCGYLWAYACTV